MSIRALCMKHLSVCVRTAAQAFFLAISSKADMEIRTIGSLEQGDDESIIKIACAQVLPSQNGMTGEEGGLNKLAQYTAKAASLGADGE